ncbi:protoporphyrinogen oxidase HemJ [Siccirubricoccus phaeus]|uniref:protoporphyrinogen oxidase HemJ n=1 Tax=Siccirubricoccus phaeus TaxID=2595053 RepID=UPI0011F1F480|nr:protoporphyrinogen oxidase HemJ [Siccirubricoccus phaeus]
MTLDVLVPAYPWVKALHLVSVIAWMAGLLYLPRLFVNHYRAAPDSPEAAMLEGMERRLLRAIMNPAMIAVWLLGLTLVLTPGVLDWRAGWWHTKLLCVLLMTGFHHHLSVSRKRLARGERRHSERYWRVANEVPTVLMVIIVIMVIVKPF